MVESAHVVPIDICLCVATNIGHQCCFRNMQWQWSSFPSLASDQTERLCDALWSNGPGACEIFFARMLIHCAVGFDDFADK